MTIAETYQPWIWGTGTLIGYLLLVMAGPIRADLRDGARCVRRHAALWMIPALLGLCYAVFQIGLQIFYHYKLEEGQAPAFIWSRPWFLPSETLMLILKGGWLPALESVAGVFNVLIVTFPFSAVAALLFFANWDGHHAVLLRALHRRFDGPGLIAYSWILLCAAAAVVKPLIYFALYYYGTDEEMALRIQQGSLVVDWLSFLFEIMFGTGVQIYLILMVYAWVRGVNFTHRHLIDFAIRRFSVVIQWSLVVMVLGTLLINIPLIISNVPPFSHYVSNDLLPEKYIDHTARPVVAAFLVFFASIQIILTFHGESLREGLRDHFRFLAKEFLHVLWFLIVAFASFYLLGAASEAVKTGFGADTAVAMGWSLFYPLPAGFISAWMLASWVCLYKRSGTGGARTENWIKY